MYREASIFYFSAPFFWCSLFFKNISTPLSFKISLRDTSFHISLNSLGFSLQNCLLNFLSCIFQHVWEKVFSLWCSHSPKMNWMYHFYSCPSPLLKTPGRIFWKSVFPQTRWRKLWFALSKFNQKIWRWLVYFHLVYFHDCNFSKCDGFTVL